MITANGEAGATVTTTGGDGTGGLICVAADHIELPASGSIISAVGTANSADGRIYLCYLYGISGDSAARCDPAGVVVNLATLPIGLG